MRGVRADELAAAEAWLRHKAYGSIYRGGHHAAAIQYELIALRDELIALLDYVGRNADLLDALARAYRAAREPQTGEGA